MEIQKCYFASFNVGNVEIWNSEFYLDKKSIFSKIEESKDEITERIEDFSVFVDEKGIKKTLQRAVSDLKKNDTYKDKENDFDFFILEKPIWKNFEQKNKIENVTN